ncbi:phage tail protein [Neisseria sp. S1]|uniref:phage tail protein n=1 Tax=Neisseria sp. S1 TaxID=3318354 RepID=UPI003A83EC7D
MEKPASLRDALAAALPELRNNPDKLAMYVVDGKTIANKHTLGHKISYRLNINITDYADGLDKLNVAVIAWLQVNQPDILGPGSVPADSYVFEADILDDKTADIAIVLRLTESVLALIDDDGKINITHRREPQLKNDLTWSGLPDEVAGAQ